MSREKPQNRRKEKSEIKDAELRLICELIKNARRSDRELAKAVGVSQPTIGRLTKKLEKEGYIKEYTIIPDFQKLGYELLVLTFVKLKRTLNSESINKARETAREELKKSQLPVIMLERGIGLKYDGVIMSLYRDFSSYIEHKNRLKMFPFLEISGTESFVISLEDETRYRPLTLLSVAKHIMTSQNEKEN